MTSAFRAGTELARLDVLHPTVGVGPGWNPRVHFAYACDSPLIDGQHAGMALYV
jgi:hypothetical protein